MCWHGLPSNWRSGATELEAVVGSTTATPAGTTSAEGITAVAAAAVFPPTGTRTALTAAAITAATAVATAAVTAATCITAAAIAAAAARSATPIATTTAATAGLGLVDAQGATHELSALQALDGARFGLVVGHFHEGEAPLAARIPLQGQGTAHHLTKGGKQFAHVFLFGPEGEIADKNAHDAKYRTRQALTQPA